MRVNVGSGSKPLSGYVNIDIQSKSADLHADCKALPFNNNSLDEIISFHLIEHLDRRDAEFTIKHWYGLLKPGGRVIIECPDIVEVMRQYLAGNEEMLFSVYGRNRYPHDTHMWGYSRASLSVLLNKLGFHTVICSDGTDYHARFEPCMRVEATK
jgi:predicted SAM-dependent methyltransferase